MDITDFSDIAPFNDEEAAAALARVSLHPNVPWISKFLFPDKPNTFLGDVLRNIHISKNHCRPENIFHTSARHGNFTPVFCSYINDLLQTMDI